ncbi:hypothetical protein Bhyg_07940 [Pseudolycoriella hygida]|uniref:Uncharacterized protein n=1 Tax=Pseudolycoriella hygida TaxID=35572 RepID=A0A9Q0N5G2_9DIPT|nr:hypothetical protein Bhyg_07940 [Pseudolycoriella hygida]
MNYNDLYEKLASVEWTPQQFYRHGKCYSKLTHSGNLSKLKTVQENALKNSNAEKEFDASLCFVCQRAGSKVSTVSTAKVAQDIWNLKEKTTSDLAVAVLATFNDVSDVLKNQLKYHSSCLIAEKRKFLVKSPVKVEDKYARINTDFLTIKFRNVMSKFHSQKYLITFFYHEAVNLAGGEIFSKLCSNELQRTGIGNVFEIGRPDVDLVKQAEKMCFYRNLHHEK